MIQSDGNFLKFVNISDNAQLLKKNNGKIYAKEVEVTLISPFGDFVFSPSYNLLLLHQLEEFIKEKNHLPGIPSASEVKENGLNLGEMDNLLLQKVEELTLYIIQQQKEIEKMSAEISKF